jgi:hypothetical protein
MARERARPSLGAGAYAPDGGTPMNTQVAPQARHPNPYQQSMQKAITTDTTAEPPQTDELHGYARAGLWALPVWAALLGISTVTHQPSYSSELLEVIEGERRCTRCCGRVRRSGGSPGLATEGVACFVESHVCAEHERILGRAESHAMSASIPELLR